MTTAGVPYAVPEPREGMLDADVAQALAGLIGAAVPTQELPPFWHWVYLLERARQEDLGDDGHPRPTASGAARTTRMFAGGRLTTLAPLRMGQRTLRRSSLQDVRSKAGRSGALTFVTVRHELIQDGTVCLLDEQDLVYRDPRNTTASVTGSTSPAPGLAHQLTLRCDPVVLFRFSALTYNAHRIHYDLAYARAEGYPGLVIHGPLQVLFMAEALGRAGHRFDQTRFEYRLVAPMFAPQSLTAGVLPGARHGSLRAQVRSADATVTATGLLLPGTDRVAGPGVVADPA